MIDAKAMMNNLFVEGDKTLNMEITQEEYQKRRNKLIEKIPNESVIVLRSEDIKYRNSHTEFPFRQDSNFYYLTGLKEPESMLVLQKENSDKIKYVLFCRERDPEDEIWIGERVGPLDAKKYYKADEAFDIAKWEQELSKLCQDKKVYFISPKPNEIKVKGSTNVINNVKLSEFLFGIKNHDDETLIRLIGELRLFKSDTEIALIKEACSISVKAQEHLMKICGDNKFEHELEGEFMYQCSLQEAKYMAYTPIVAGGKNACTLHYIQNNQRLNSKDLLLVDAGCEYQYYASDITRTYPVNGKFSQDQRAIYELVLKAQEAAIYLVKPGLKWNALQETILKVLVTGLVRLGILQGDVNKLIQEKAYKKYYMHSSGHWLGLDVHDVGEYKINADWRPLEERMIFTIEPGLYFRPSKDLDERWWNIGIRIEDDILVTKTGCEVLTGELSKSVESIEKLMNGNLKK